MIRTLFGIFLALSVLAKAPEVSAQSQAARALEYEPKFQLEDAEPPTQQVVDARADVLKLPPLNDLIEVAKQLSPNQKFLREGIKVEEQRRKIHRWADLLPLQVNADGFRGNLDVYSINADAIGGVRPSAAVQDRTNYQAAIALRILPANIFINKANRRIAEIEAERMGLLAEQSGNALAGEIAYLHGSLVKSIDLMDLYAESTEIGRANAEMAKRLFHDGSMTLADYSSVVTAAVDASAKFDNARGDFRLYYQMLMTKVYGRMP